MVKVTNFVAHTTGEGQRLTYTYSTINENGDLIDSNTKGTCIVVDSEIQAHIDALYNFLENKIYTKLK